MARRAWAPLHPTHHQEGDEHSLCPRITVGRSRLCHLGSGKMCIQIDHMNGNLRKWLNPWPFSIHERQGGRDGISILQRERDRGWKRGVACLRCPRLSEAGLCSTLPREAGFAAIAPVSARAQAGPHMPTTRESGRRRTAWGNGHSLGAGGPPACHPPEGNHLMAVGWA